MVQSLHLFYCLLFLRIYRLKMSAFFFRSQFNYFVVDL